MVIPTTVSSQLNKSLSKYDLRTITMNWFAWHRSHVPKGLVDDLIKRVWVGKISRFEFVSKVSYRF